MDIFSIDNTTRISSGGFFGKNKFASKLVECNYVIDIQPVLLINTNGINIGFFISVKIVHCNSILIVGTYTISNELMC